MNEQALSLFEFKEEFKEKLVELVLYKNMSAEQTTRKYGLSNMTILINWINNYKRKLEKGAVPMEKPGTKDVTALKKRIKDLEKALEKANVLIYGLNFMIDHAEKENKIAIRKKRGTKQ
ncbi:transposase [Sphingobacterium sp. BIGb0116]|uniref:transposase n=1 Tax=Sphingobacterium sp. BIGb0116 TaxID=2940619 RepID=UPI0021674AF7|nr:transposase [Sphingobacterium sp. BIGb0116]MCS4162939.1 transposase-like protein [Sphingobacterium sp. BIGb0116]